jgi:uroporphyrin-III C-methyltransferase
VAVGKVYLIGAGSGDPDLITLKAVQALQKAEVVLVDDLVNPAILEHCLQARVVQVGKRGGCQSTPQHFINKMMVSLAEQGQVVARLKGGDPFLFGRGGEEMLALREADVAYEIIPGVTAGLGATASIEMPITHRDFTHGVSFITGHTQDNSPIQWTALVASKTTLVIYMGMTHIAEITRNLLQAGMPADMPAMILENGSLPEQRAMVTALENLPMEAHQHQMQSPSLIIVGEVVRLAKVEKLLSTDSVFPFSLNHLVNAA